MATQEERRAATRDAVLKTARRMFGASGYEAITIDQIAAEAGVAKGSVYHHYSTKADLFEAVLHDATVAILADVHAALKQQTDMRSALLAGLHAFFASCSKPNVAQIFLIDGPSVLGWSTWRRIDTAHFGGMVRDGLIAAMEAGVIAKRPIDPLVDLILGAVTEAALKCASAKNFAKAAKEYLAALEAILDGLGK